MHTDGERTGHKQSRQVVCGFIFAAFALLAMLTHPLFAAASAPGANSAIPSRRTLPENWDPNRYIGIEEITPGVEAYCLTDFGEAGIEKFRLVVMKVMRDIEPGRDTILVKGIDERFIKTGPVVGCSGSPVYVNNRLAGALASAWTFSKEPIYGVTPIADMLRVGLGGQSAVNSSRPPRGRPGFTFDFFGQIDVARIHRQIMAAAGTSFDRGGPVAALPCPMLVSGLPAETFEQLRSWFESFGLMAVRGVGGTTAKSGAGRLVPGAALAVPLLIGDMRIMVLGTATEVRDDRVYAFGHNFLGYGPVNLPMATAEVHAIVPSLYRSLKIGEAREIVGTITADENAGVFGKIGVEPNMIPIKITVDRYNDTQRRIYNCSLTANEYWAPLVVQAALSGAGLQLGSLPPDHTVRYNASLSTKTGDVIRFGNISTTLGLNELMAESVSTIALLMDNPYRKVEVQSIECELRITSKNSTSHIWSVNVADPKVKRGQEVVIDVVVESFLSEKTKHRIVFKIPQDLPAGTYSLMLCGSAEYERFLRKVMPYRFVALNYSSMIEALNDVLNIDRGRLYCMLILPPGGISLERAELPDLPPTRTLILQSPTRVVRTQPYPHWIEKTVETGTVITDRETVNIVVEN